MSDNPFHVVFEAEGYAMTGEPYMETLDNLRSDGWQPGPGSASRSLGPFEDWGDESDIVLHEDFDYWTKDGAEMWVSAESYPETKHITRKT